MDIRGGITAFHVGGVTYDVKGNLTYNLNDSKVETIVGANRVHGVKIFPQDVAVEGTITDAGNLDVAAFCAIRNKDVHISLANGKTVTFSQAWYTGDGKVTSEEGEISFKFSATRVTENTA